jgi:hypothetical protein
MRDRANLTGAIIAVVSFSVAAILVLFFQNPIGVSYSVILIPNFGYAAYWAFSIRKALAVPTYRRQAFGIGILVVTIFGALTLFILVPSSTSAASTLVQFVGFYVLFLVLFYWIDASVLTTRRYDPLLRDVLYWRKIRVPLWTAIVVTTMIPLLLLSYVVATSDVSMLNQLNNNTFGGPIISMVLLIVVNFPIVIPIIGIIYLPAIALRSKWNKNLRRHFLWFAPTAVCILLLFFGPLSGTNSLFENALNGVLATVMGYTLYRSAKSLVPMNRISTADITKAENPPS